MNSNSKSKKENDFGIPMKLRAFGFIKPDKNGFVVICVNLSLSAQGRTIDSAMKKMTRLIDGYLNHVAEKHPEKWDKLTNRPVPGPIMAEYLDIVTTQLLSNLSESRTPRPLSPLALMADAVRRKRGGQVTPLPNYTFAEEISTPYAQTSM